MIICSHIHGDCSSKSQPFYIQVEGSIDATKTSADVRQEPYNLPERLKPWLWQRQSNVVMSCSLYDYVSTMRFSTWCLCSFEWVTCDLNHEETAVEVPRPEYTHYMLNKISVTSSLFQWCFYLMSSCFEVLSVNSKATDLQVVPSNLQHGNSSLLLELLLDFVVHAYERHKTNKPLKLQVYRLLTLNYVEDDDNMFR